MSPVIMWCGAVANVIKNAHEAFAVSRMRYRSGTIRVTTRAVDEEWLDIVVQDDGVGLSEGRPGRRPAVRARRNVESRLWNRFRVAYRAADD